MPVFDSPRMTLRPLKPSEASELLAVFRDPAVRRYLLDDTLVSDQWVCDEIRESEQRFARGSAGLWAIRLPDHASIIGFVGFRDFFDPPQLQLLYGLLPQYWHEGLATEAATIACEHAFTTLGFSEIRAATDRPNQASIRVLTRLGMSEVAASDEGPAGTLFFAVTREAWRKSARVTLPVSFPRT